MGNPSPRSPANSRPRNPAKDIGVLSEAYNNNSNYDEESSDLISYAVSTCDAIKGSRINANSLVSLIETYSGQSGYDESASELCDAICRTAKSLKSSRRSVPEAVSLIETYSGQSGYDESASELCDVTFQTIDALKGTSLKVQEHIVPIIETYSGQSGYDESASDLCDVTCRTIDSLGKNDRCFADVLRLVDIYASQSGYDESASDLCDVTCKSLEYLASHEVKLETFLDRVVSVKETMQKESHEEHNSQTELINELHWGIYRSYKALKEKVRFYMFGVPVQSVSAAELYDLVTGEKYATLDKKREREVREPEKSPEIVVKKDDGKDRDKGKSKGPIFI